MRLITCTRCLFWDASNAALVPIQVSNARMACMNAFGRSCSMLHGPEARHSACFVIGWHFRCCTHAADCNSAATPPSPFRSLLCFGRLHAYPRLRWQCDTCPDESYFTRSEGCRRFRGDRVCCKRGRRQQAHQPWERAGLDALRGRRGAHASAIYSHRTHVPRS